MMVGYALHQRGLMSDKATNFLIKFNIRFVYGLLTLLSFWVLPLNRDLAVLLPFGIVYVGVPGLAGMLLTRRKLPDPAERGACMMSAMLSNIGTLSGVCAFILFQDPGFAYCQIIAACQNTLLVLVCFPLAAHYKSLAEINCRSESTGISRKEKPDGKKISGGSDGPDAGAGSGEQHNSGTGKIPDPPAKGAPPGAWNSRWSIHWGKMFSWNQISLLGIVAGLLLNATGIERPEILGDIFPALVHTGAWTALLPVGCLISFRKVRSYLGKVRDLTLLRFVLMPLFIWCVARFLFRDQILLDTMLLCAMAPTAINAVLVSRLYSLNTDLAASSFMITTALYLMVIFPLFVVLHN